MKRTLLFAALICTALGATAQKVTSPDGKLELSFSMVVLTKPLRGCSSLVSISMLRCTRAKPNGQRPRNTPRR